MPAWRIKLPLFLNYFLFAMLLNSVGTVILQVQRNFSVSAPAASLLEACKDLSIAVVSFFVASSVARFGYRRAMLAALAFIGCVLAIMPSLASFAATKLLFVATGASFALIKVSVFAAVGLIARNERDHASFMSFLESFFMVGILSSYFLFGAFVGHDAGESTDWFRVYYVLAGLAALSFALVHFTPLDESAAHAHEIPGARLTLAGEFMAMLRLALSPLVLVFVVSVFVYVMTEQGIMSWLPTFNNQVLHLPPALSIEMASILAASTALGRFVAGWMLRRLPWFSFVAGCLVAAAVLVVVALPLAKSGPPAVAITGWHDAPLAAFVFPLIGFFIAPVYPVINSAILSALPRRQHGAMTGLIVIFSALGGTVGSLTVGRIFEAYGGEHAFYLSLVPLGTLIACLAVFRRLQKVAPAADALAKAH